MTLENIAIVRILLILKDRAIIVAECRLRLYYDHCDCKDPINSLRILAIAMFSRCYRYNRRIICNDSYQSFKDITESLEIVDSTIVL